MLVILRPIILNHVNKKPMRGLSTFLFVVFANTAFAQSFDTSDTHNVKWQQGPLTVDNFHVVDTKEKNPDSTHYGAFATGRVPYRFPTDKITLFFGYRLILTMDILGCRRKK